MGRPRKDGVVEEISDAVVQRSEAVVQTQDVIVQTPKVVVPLLKGVRVTPIEGFISDIKKYVEDLPAGEVPVSVITEAVNKRIMGRATFLVVTKADETSKLKCKVLDALGIVRLNEMLQAVDLAKIQNLIIIPAQVNRRTLQTQYLAILVGE